MSNAHESLIDLMRENPEGFKAGENGAQRLKEMEASGICYELDGWWYLQDEYLQPSL